jgi:hypothetical protein
MEISRSRHLFYDVTFFKGQVRWQSYGRRHKKALGRARKSGGEGESLILLKESGAFFCFERDILADDAQEIGRDAEKRGEVLLGKVMHVTVLCRLRWACGTGTLSFHPCW